MTGSTEPSRLPVSLTPLKAASLPLASALGLAILAMANVGTPSLFRAIAGAAAFLVAWAGWLVLTAGRRGRVLVLDKGIYRHHWVQVLAQCTVFFYWGWHVRFVYAFLPLLAAQVVFAYGVDALLTWSRRDRYALGFGPIPVILSINLFLWFRPEWFHWQFVMIVLGYCGKELIRWQRDGRSAHIFNPSSFPLAVFALVLILTGSSDLTYGNFIANSQFDPPHIYAVIFLAALAGQILFGVASMTLSAVVTLYLIGQVFLAATGTYLFFDAFIPVPVFLGMHLLFTDPSTSPRTEIGRILFGVLYASAIAVFYVVLRDLGIPTFYDKLLPVPLLNLTVRRLDAIARGLRGPAPARAPGGPGISVPSRNLAYTFTWVGVFAALSATRAVGDRHPGQYLPFWLEACADGSSRACDYAAYLTLTYCNNGSGWACNETGIQLARSGEDARASFQRACELGFAPGCENAARAAGDPGEFARAGPGVDDLPIVLRGTKPALTERDPDVLQDLGCRQGWSGLCSGRG